jgi:hypothetical protein
MMISIYLVENKTASPYVDGFGDVGKGILNVIPSFLMRFKDHVKDYKQNWDMYSQFW